MSTKIRCSEVLPQLSVGTLREEVGALRRSARYPRRRRGATPQSRRYQLSL